MLKNILLFIAGLTLLFSSVYALDLSRVKTWDSGDILTHTDLNAEFDNILNHSISNSDIASDAAIPGSKLNLAIPGAIGGTTPAAGAFTTLSASSTFSVAGTTTMSGLTASKALALNASKEVVSSGITLPSGAVFFMISGSCPTGTTDVTATYSNKFVRINATGGSTGGADTHTQTYSSTSGAGSPHTHDRGGGGGASTQFGGGDSYIATESAHTHAISGTTSAGNNVPAYVTCKMCQVD